MKCLKCKRVWDLGESEQEEDFICSYCVEKQEAEK